jgi:hypothetical protein
MEIYVNLSPERLGVLNDAMIDWVLLKAIQNVESHKKTEIN